jgi:hypothetical protein
MRSCVIPATAGIQDARELHLLDAGFRRHDGRLSAATRRRL